MMFTDLAFLQVSAPAAGELTGLAPELEQPAENIEFSTLLPLVQAPLLVNAGDALPVPAAGQATLAELLQSGQLLPPAGAGLPQPGPSPHGEPGARMIPVLVHGVPHPHQHLVHPLPPGQAVNALDAQAAMPLPDPALERQLPPQLAISLSNGGAERVAITPMVGEAVAEAGDPGVETLPLRLAAGERSSAARVTSLPSMTLTVDKPGWQPALGERLVWMVSHAQQRAEIKLDPPQLGRLDVQIVMQGERAQLAFVAETPVGRELLEQSLPRLRDMMADAGIDLADVNIAHRERHAAQQDDANTNGSGDASQLAATVAEDASVSEAVAAGTALLDVFV